MATSRSRGSRRVTSRSPKRIVPSSACSSPARRRSRVDFPHPLGPTSTAKAPSGTSIPIPRSTCVAPNRLLTPVTVTDVFAERVAELISTSVAADLALGNEERARQRRERDRQAAVGCDRVRLLIGGEDVHERRARRDRDLHRRAAEGGGAVVPRVGVEDD